MDVPHHALARKRMLWGLGRFASDIHRTSASDIIVVICERTSPQVIGYAIASEILPWDRRCTVSLYLVPSGRNHLVEAHLLLYDHLFKWFPLEQVLTISSSDEVDSHRVLKMLGYDECGLIPSAYITGLSAVSTTAFRLTPSVWKERRQLALTSIAATAVLTEERD